jgi:hypothetical protein
VSGGDVQGGGVSGGHGGADGVGEPQPVALFGEQPVQLGWVAVGLLGQVGVVDAAPHSVDVVVVFPPTDGGL